MFDGLKVFCMHFARRRFALHRLPPEVATALERLCQSFAWRAGPGAAPARRPEGWERYSALRIRRWVGFDHLHRPVMSPLLERAREVDARGARYRGRTPRVLRTR